MQFVDPSDVAAIIAAITAVLAVFAWLVRRWIKDQIERLVLPHLKNDETSVATYAHEARDAANLAGESALAAKYAALDAKSAALTAADAATRTEAAVKSLQEKVN